MDYEAQLRRLEHLWTGEGSRSWVMYTKEVERIYIIADVTPQYSDQKHRFLMKRLDELHELVSKADDGTLRIGPIGRDDIGLVMRTVQAMPGLNSPRAEEMKVLLMAPYNTETGDTHIIDDPVLLELVAARMESAAKKRRD